MTIARITINIYFMDTCPVTYILSRIYTFYRKNLSVILILIDHFMNNLFCISGSKLPEETGNIRNHPGIFYRWLDNWNFRLDFN